MVNFVHSRPILYKIENEVLFDSNCFKPDYFDKSHNNKTSYKHFYLGDSDKLTYMYLT